MRKLNFLALLMAVPAFAGDLPEALRRVHAERQRVETGLVKWSEEDAAGAQDAKARLRFFSTRVAGDTVFQTAIGDEDGVVVRREDGSVGANGRSAFLSVQADGEIWTVLQGTHYAHVWEDGGRMAPPPDVRSFGVQAEPGGRSVYDPNWFGRKDLQAAKFRESVDGGLRLVRADFPGGTALQWWIDPQKGWSVVRAIQFAPDGTSRYESRSTVTEQDGVWLPAEVVFFSSDFQAGKMPYKTVRVQNAAINRLDQPARLGPSDLQLEAGTMVAMHDAETMQATDLRAWDGSALVTLSEWQQRLRAGTASYGPGLLREVERRKGVVPGATAAPSPEVAPPVSRTVQTEGAWEKFTREFISKHQLDADQAQRAWTICRECEADRDAYLRQRREDFADLEQRERRALGAAATASHETENLAERRRELEAPVQRIFDERLKPHLEKLPTREQRAIADGPTSRPAGTP